MRRIHVNTKAGGLLSVVAIDQKASSPPGGGGVRMLSVGGHCHPITSPKERHEVRGRAESAETAEGVDGRRGLTEHLCDQLESCVQDGGENGFVGRIVEALLEKSPRNAQGRCDFGDADAGGGVLSDELARFRHAPHGAVGVGRRKTFDDTEHAEAEMRDVSVRTVSLANGRVAELGGQIAAGLEVWGDGGEGGRGMLADDVFVVYAEDHDLPGNGKVGEATGVENLLSTLIVGGPHGAGLG